MNRTTLTLALVGSLFLAGALTATASVNDSWITTRAKIALLTSDGFSVNGASVDTKDGNVTIHGKVKTAADSTRAEETVRKVKGVKSVSNLLQVVPGDVKDLVDASDSGMKDRVEASLKADPLLNDVKVASVNNGVVLLTGKAESSTVALRAIENAYGVAGVQRVASEIQTGDN